MDFFAQQDRARRNSRRLIGWYLLAAVSVVASYCVVAALVYAFWAIYAGLPLRGGAPEWHGLFSTYFRALLRVPYQVYGVVAGVVGAFILGVSAYRVWQLSEGGPAIAELLGARYIESGRCTPSERRLLNVVEEMAIASGIAVPPVYVLDRDAAINALVAGHSPNEAVIIVTQGVHQLSRDELQGMMGHEFSHILNGDMALNLRLVGLLAGLSRLGEIGERMVYWAAQQSKEARAEGRVGAVEAWVGAIIAFVAFPGTFAAEAIKGAISRERELLADAASVQFTRNPDALAGALDSILALRAPTTVQALHATEFSHMFFATAVGRWWGFPSHPPIAERIRHAHPSFLRDEYRATRHGIRNKVAVLDGLGNIIKTTAAIETVGKPAAQHVDYAARLLAQLPTRLREALRRPDQAEQAMFALALDQDKSEKAAELEILASRRGPGMRAKVVEMRVYTGTLARHHMLTLADLAVPAIKEQPQEARDAFLADLSAMVQADRRMTLREFVLVTLLRQRLREGAGQPIRTRFRNVEEVSADVHAIVSLIAHSTKGDPRARFDKGAAVLKLGWQAPLPMDKLNTAQIGDALERLRHLSPFAKPGVLKACFETAAADGTLRLAEAELVRMVAATLDCPVPPLLAAKDPQALAA